MLPLGVLEQAHALWGKELMSFEKQHLARFWALKQTEPLSTGHHMTKQQELPTHQELSPVRTTKSDE